MHVPEAPTMISFFYIQFPLSLFFGFSFSVSFFMISNPTKKHSPGFGV